MIENKDATMTLDENQFFRQSIQYLFGSLDIKKAISRFKDYITQYIPADVIILGVYNPDTNEARMLASIYPDTITPPPSLIKMPDRLWDLHREKWQEAAQTDYVNNLHEDRPEMVDAISQIMPTDGSYLFMDLEQENQRLGILGIYAKGTHRFNDTHMNLISSLHDPFTSAISNALKHEEIKRLKKLLEDDNRYLNHRLIEMTGDTIIGADFGLSHVMEMVQQVAPLNSHVLILGETGVGKEVFANAIHNASDRKKFPLIKVNCGAIPEGLIDSELFGHEKGAFTGAVATKRGRFERAHHSTIFLDEIGELPLDAQVRLLHVLQEKRVERVGGTESIPVDVRIISATHRNLSEMVKQGTFREDLWYRLNVFPIMIPPLRQRPEDIPALIQYFMEKKSRELKTRQSFELSAQLISRMQNYQWPGNVRELENFIERLIITGPDHNTLNMFNSPAPGSSETLQANHPLTPTTTETRSLDQVLTTHIKTVLDQTNGKVEGPDGAATLLKCHPSTLRAKMKKLNIPFGRSTR
jgi:transcriptional regulator with GAF, ATPase, and Fis domain